MRSKEIFSNKAHNVWAPAAFYWAILARIGENKEQISNTFFC